MTHSGCFVALVLYGCNSIIVSLDTWEDKSFIFFTSVIIILGSLIPIKESACKFPFYFQLMQLKKNQSCWDFGLDCVESMYQLERN